MNKIVESVLNLAVLSATKFPVGLQSRVEDVIQTIKNKSMKVCTIGICGLGGSGKSTLATIKFMIHSRTKVSLKTLHKLVKQEDMFI